MLRKLKLVEKTNHVYLEDGARIEYRLFSEPVFEDDISPSPALVSELFSYMENSERQILLIDYIKVDSSNEGKGTRILRKFLENHTEVIVCALSGVVHTEYPRVSEEERKYILARLKHFYEKSGFYSLSELLGYTGCTIEPFIYAGTKHGMELVNQIRSRV